MKNLMEHEAKALLTKYGIPTTTPFFVESLEEARTALKKIDGPVALKVASRQIPHKGSIGGVRLGVTDDTLEGAFESVIAAGRRVAGDEVSGVILESMVSEGIEVIAGAIFHESFGPVVMLGRGGSDVERRADVAFALAPVGESAALYLVSQLKDHVALSASEESILVGIILALGGADGLIFREQIAEVDINPLIVSNGRIMAVDAHAVVDNARSMLKNWRIPSEDERRNLYATLKPAFEPNNIVVAGASTKPGKLGFNVVRNLVDYGFPGRIYCTHPTANNIYGCEVYPSVSALPDEVDRAIVIVPARSVADTLRQCGEKGVKVAQVYSAGFTEWDEGGEKLEDEIRRVIRETGIRVIGPNTIGTFSSAGGLTLTAPRYSPRGKGNIAFIGQSGTYALDVVSRSTVMGLPLGVSLSCGNCLDVKPTDYLSYFAEDQATRVIAMYLESSEDCGSFFRLAESVDKPLVLLKGGQTDAGLRAAASHTGALGSDNRLWRAAARQCNAIVVDDINELMDVLLALTAFSGRRPGRSIALFTSGGGISVSAADAAASNGIAMVELSSETQSALSQYTVPGTSIDNPVDIPVWGLKVGEEFIFDHMIDTLAQDQHVDAVIACVEMGSVFSFTADELSGLVEMDRIADSIQRARLKKPLYVVFRTTGERVQDDYVRAVRQRLLQFGIAVYSTIEQAIRAHAAIAIP